MTVLNDIITKVKEVIICKDDEEAISFIQNAVEQKLELINQNTYSLMPCNNCHGEAGFECDECESIGLIKQWKSKQN